MVVMGLRDFSVMDAIECSCELLSISLVQQSMCSLKHLASNRA